MISPNRDANVVEPGEESFIRTALAKVEKAEKVERIKSIALKTLALAAAFAFAFRASGPDLNIECTVLIGVALIAAICTARIMSLMNKNTKEILRAVVELQKK